VRAREWALFYAEIKKRYARYCKACRAWAIVTVMVTADTTLGVRQRRWRQRQKDPVHAVARVEYQRDKVLEALILTGRLSETETLRRDLVERQISIVLSSLAPSPPLLRI
jgi:hypothetical protein